METEVVTEVTNKNAHENIIEVFEIRTDVNLDVILTHDFDEVMTLVRGTFREQGGKLVRVRCTRMDRAAYERMEDM